MLDKLCEAQAFNAVVYPAPALGLQPVLGVDVLSFKSWAQAVYGRVQVAKRTLKT